MDTNIFQETEPAIIVVIGVFIVFFMSMVLLLFFYFSKKKIVEKELEKKDIEIKYRQELIQATLQVQEDERKRIAQDMHDEVSSKLNIVNLNSHLITNPKLSAQEIEEAKNNITQTVNKVLESSRRIAHDLLPPVLDKFGLDAGLEELCSDFNTKLLTVNYNNSTVFNTDDKSRHLHVYRIIQELINNSIKHGGATLIDVSFNKTNDIFNCIYTDNGKGFDVAEARAKKGLGMKNIDSRVIYLDGSIDISSKAGEGTTVKFSF